jgi:hypothetical protein
VNNGATTVLNSGKSAGNFHACIGCSSCQVSRCSPDILCEVLPVCRVSLPPAVPLLFRFLLVRSRASAAATTGSSCIFIFDRRCILYQEEAVSRVELKYSKPPKTPSTSTRSILHARPSFHTRHFLYRHPYTRLQHRLGHPSRTNLTDHMALCCTALCCSCSCSCSCSYSG